ncbi:hypothetical protein QBC37DRAFT_59160 [Rhypophila decipiens]|uniref:Uncharacterized protein n=1 Tax=Rhypophila decipiens TaxID=261697 RepID=A0AAN7B3Y3_9PEZI|nr:hypothetical protein QBC37DRAFT_59160 [Rhypophila decipiens]
MAAESTKATMPSSHEAPAVHQDKSNLPLHLLRHGSGLIGFGLLFGFLVPMTPYPRLGLTAHIQFAVEGTMVCAAGLILGSKPFTSTFPSTPKAAGSASPEAQTVADRLKPWQVKLVYCGCAGIWVTLMSEVANAWWGTRWVLPIAHHAAGLAVNSTGPAAVWMERVVAAAHYPFAILLATVWPVITAALFSSD